MFLFALFSWLELAAKYPSNLQIFNFLRIIENLEVNNGI